VGEVEAGMPVTSHIKIPHRGFERVGRFLEIAELQFFNLKIVL
jgi:hypothetical protein